MRKKIIFFIVEGISDSAALSDSLEKIFNSNQVTVRITDGDITSRNGTSPQNIQNKIVDEIKGEFGKSFKPKDFAEVVHLVDIDGVFIDDKNVIQANVNHPFYDPESIKCKNTEIIKKRNLEKANVLKKLISLSHVWGTIPYSVYFFSTNLDHVLHNNANLANNEKYSKAVKFAMRYKDDICGFIDFFCNNDFSINTDYNDSWDFIKKDNNSLKRYSNVNLLFTEKAKNYNFDNDNPS